MAEADALADLSILVEAARAGGAAALALQGQATQWDKDDGTPVSDGDLAADDAIATILSARRPHYGILTEERGGAAEQVAPVFIVDPIDGTRAYLAGKPDWSVVVARVDGGRPIAGVVFQPRTGALFTAVAGQGAFCGERPLRLRQLPSEGAVIAAPGPLHTSAGGLRDQGFARAPYVGSLALRLMRVADGTFGGVITKAGPHHWDLAAADIIVQEAGGLLTSLNGSEPRYNTVVTRHGPVVAGAASVIDRLRAFAQSRYAAAA
ncbi:MAG: inositol monophosphatase [Pseudomonadota bacterium]